MCPLAVPRLHICISACHRDVSCSTRSLLSSRVLEQFRLRSSSEAANRLNRQSSVLLPCRPPLHVLLFRVDYYYCAPPSPFIKPRIASTSLVLRWLFRKWKKPPKQKPPRISPASLIISHGHHWRKISVSHALCACLLTPSSHGFWQGEVKTACDSQSQCTLTVIATS